MGAAKRPGVGLEQRDAVTVEVRRAVETSVELVRRAGVGHSQGDPRPEGRHELAGAEGRGRGLFLAGHVGQRPDPRLRRARRVR